MNKMTRFLIGIPLVLFGLLPALAFFVWIERNMALPWLGTWIRWPWIFVDGEISFRVLFNVALIGVFGWIHSLLAGRAPRALYTIVAGCSAFLLMSFWQNTGVLLYQLVPEATMASLISFFLYWGFLTVGVQSLAEVEQPTRFVGLVGSTSTENTPPHLWQGGLYSYVRHPLYTLTLAAWFITPMMSLDRLVFGGAMSLYLAVGIRREERRLVALFGKSYEEYQRRTPMLLPKFSRGFSSSD